MSTTIAILATGLFTPLGHGVDDTAVALLNGRHISNHARADLRDGDGSEPGDLPKPMARVEYLAAQALYEAFNFGFRRVSADGGWFASPRTALVIGTSRGPVDDWINRQYASTLSHGYGLSSLGGRLARLFGHGDGPRLTFCGACASGLHALIGAAQLIEQGAVDRAVVVGAESSLHPIFLQSFHRLGVLAPQGARCRPFDVNRQGLLISEAAAAVVIARVDEPQAGDVLIDRYAYAGDAAHLTGFDPAGATMRRMLATAIDCRPVDVIHAHGTGTVENDAAEASAIESLLDDLASSNGGSMIPPAVYSHKGAIGHSLGASGIVSVVLNVMMHRHGIVPPNIGIETPMPLNHATLNLATVQRPVNRSVVCAAGFGGATAALSLATSPDAPPHPNRLAQR